MSTVPVWINGRRGHRIDALDRGFLYGDGLFETFLIKAQTPQLWSEHLTRLNEGCMRLGFPLPDPAILHEEALHACQGIEQGVLKLQVTRGGGGRGYAPPHPVEPTRVFSLHPLPSSLDSKRQQGVRVRLCNTVLGINPALAGIKHCNRLEQILARQEWVDAEVYEGLMCDSEGYLVEGIMTNLFWFQRNSWLTPRLDRCGVAGIMRAWVMAKMEEWGYQVREVREKPASLMEAEEVFLTNSVAGIIPVVEWICRSRTWPVGVMTRNLQVAWE